MIATHPTESGNPRGERHLHRHPRRWVCRKELPVQLVELGKIVSVGDEHSGVDHELRAAAARAEYSINVAKRLRACSPNVEPTG